MKKILITGGNGQLATTFRNLASEYKNYQFKIKSKNNLDITNSSSLKREIYSNDYDFIINCAAFTNVDEAETQKDNALLVNSESVKSILDLIGDTKTKLIQISTDYIFDGKQQAFYKEEDIPNPINHYGYSKLLAEEHIFNSKSKALIVRTSWLYSEYCDNFLIKILNLASKQEKINVTNLEIGSPTYALDLAKFCLFLCDQNLSWDGEIYNFSNSGYTSRYNFAKEIVKKLSIDCNITPKKIKSDLDVLRPLNSRLSLDKIKSKFDYTPIDWLNSLDICINRIK